jgi:hypothetical protein
MDAFPRTTIEGLSVSRMIIGTNWFFGWSHTSAAKDTFIKNTMTVPKIADIIETFVNAGVDTIMGLIEYPGLKDAVTEAEQRTGRKVIVISTPGFNSGETAAARGEAERTIENNAKLGAALCMPHTSTTDPLVDSRIRKIRDMDIYCRMIRKYGMIPGLSTHLPESIVFADESGLDVATYISIYNAAGFLMPLEADWIHRVIWKAKHPVITIKPLAAGRLLPLVGMAFSWATLRPCDMVTVGTMSPDEAKELIELSLSILERRQDDVVLQKTRSKQTVITKS